MQFIKNTKMSDAMNNKKYLQNPSLKLDESNHTKPETEHKGFSKLQESANTSDVLPGFSLVSPSNSPKSEGLSNPKQDYIKQSLLNNEPTLTCSSQLQPLTNNNHGDSNLIILEEPEESDDGDKMNIISSSKFEEDVNNIGTNSNKDSFESSRSSSMLEETLNSNVSPSPVPQVFEIKKSSNKIESASEDDRKSTIKTKQIKLESTQSKIMEKFLDEDFNSESNSESESSCSKRSSHSEISKKKELRTLQEDLMSDSSDQSSLESSPKIEQKTKTLQEDLMSDSSSCSGGEFPLILKNSIVPIEIVQKSFEDEEQLQESYPKIETYVSTITHHLQNDQKGFQSNRQFYNVDSMHIGSVQNSNHRNGQKIQKTNQKKIIESYGSDQEDFKQLNVNSSKAIRKQSRFVPDNPAHNNPFATNVASKFSTHIVSKLNPCNEVRPEVAQEKLEQQYNSKQIKSKLKEEIIDSSSESDKESNEEEEASSDLSDLEDELEDNYSKKDNTKLTPMPHRREVGSQNQTINPLMSRLTKKPSGYQGERLIEKIDKKGYHLETQLNIYQQQGVSSTLLKTTNCQLSSNFPVIGILSKEITKKDSSPKIFEFQIPEMPQSKQQEKNNSQENSDQKKQKNENDSKKKPAAEQKKIKRISSKGSIELNAQQRKPQKREYQRNFDYMVDDILDVDIYNRFDVYYLNKIKASPEERRNLPLSKFSTQLSKNTRKLSLDSNTESNSCCQSSCSDLNDHLKFDQLKSQSSTKTKLRSFSEMSDSMTDIIEAIPQLKAQCQICENHIEDSTEHLLMFYICEHKFHYSCLDQVHERSQLNGLLKEELLMCPACPKFTY